jgi:hypothetical protein
VSPAKLLDAMAAAGLAIAWGPGATVRVLDPDAALLADPVLVAYMRDYRDYLAIALRGSVTGHRWHSCNRCGELQLLRATKTNDGRACRMTVGCPGAVHPSPLAVPARPRLRKVAVPPVPSARPSLAPKSGTHTRKASRSSTARRDPPWSARPGDHLTLVTCPEHLGARWVKSNLVDGWRCTHLVERDDGWGPCGLPAQCSITATITEPWAITPDNEET